MGQKGTGVLGRKSEVKKIHVNSFSEKNNKKTVKN